MNWILDTLTVLLCIGFIISGIFFSLFCILYSREGILLGGLIPEHYYRFFPWGLLITLFHVPIIIQMTFSWALIVVVSITFLFYVTLILTQELCLEKKEYRSVGDLRQAGNLALTYRTLQLLMTIAMEFMGRFLVIFHCATTIIPIYANFVLIRYWEDMDFVGKGLVFMFAALAIFSWIIVLQFGKYLFIRGENTLCSWKGAQFGSKREGKIMGRFRKSCRRIVLCHGNTLVLARITQFKYVKGVVRGTFRSLLTLARKLEQGRQTSL